MKEIMKWLGAVLISLGVFGSAFVFAGCGAAPEDAAPLTDWKYGDTNGLYEFGKPDAAPPSFITTFHFTEPSASEVSGDYGTAAEALTSSSVIPLYYGHLQGGCTAAEDVGCADGRNSYCPHVGAVVGGSDDCLVPLTRVIKIGVNFNTAVGPETQVNFRQAYIDMINSTQGELGSAGWGITSVVGNAPAHVAYGSLPGSGSSIVLGDTSCSKTLQACVTLPGRGDVRFCQYDTSTCTTSFDEHHIAQAMASLNITNPTSKYNYVRNLMKHEFGHMIGLGHIGDHALMEADDSNFVQPATLQTYDPNMMSALKNYRP